MSNGVSSASKAGIAIGSVIAVAAALLLANNLPERMPPDPFENNEPREGTLEVFWAGKVNREQHIVWVAGEESGDIHTEGNREEDHSGWFWNHHVVVFQGDTFSLTSSQSFFGPVHCTFYVNEELVDENSSQQLEGCHVEGVVP